jgi:uncharacterized membrane protein YeaQ/YmgE (transglycosylase-associated protein family)
MAHHMLLFSLPEFIMTEFKEHKSLIFFVVLGFASGVISQMILPGRGFGMIATIAIGIIGAWLGTKYLQEYLTFIEDPVFRKVAAAILGAMVLSIVINLIRGGSDKDLTHWRHN